MVKFTNAFLVTATIVGAVPSLAYNTPYDTAVRAINTLTKDPVMFRQYVEDVYGRKLTDKEFKERERFTVLLMRAAQISGLMVGKVIQERPLGFSKRDIYEDAFDELD